MSLALSHAPPQLDSCAGPLQFSKNEDFDEYPRQREADRAMLHQAGCAAVFEPASLYASRE